MKLQPRYIFIASLSAMSMLQAAIALPLSLPGDYHAIDTLIHEELDARDVDTSKLLQRIRPDSFLLIKSFKDEISSKNQSSPEPKQIPIISDIERIKKVIEIIEFIGGKVNTIIESLPEHQAQASPPAIIDVEVAKKVPESEALDVDVTTWNSTNNE